MLSVFEKVSQRWGLELNVQKTKILSTQSDLHEDEQVAFVDMFSEDDSDACLYTPDKPVMLSRGGQDMEVESVDRFVYLGSTVSSDDDLNREISYRISRAGHAFSKLRGPLWCRHDIHLRIKTAVYKAIVIPTLLYASETWPITQQQIHRLETFQMQCLRTMLGVSRLQRLRNVAIRKRCNVFSIEHVILQGRLRWFGHMVRMDSDRIPCKVLFGQPKGARRPVGRPRQRWLGMIQDDLRRIGHRRDWHIICKDRAKWRAVVLGAIGAVTE